MLRSLAALATALLLAGCAATPAAPSGPAAPATSGAATPSAATPTASSSPQTSAPETSAAAQVIEISLKGGKVTPNGDRVTLAKGTVLRLVITSDHDDEVHVHGYDVEIAVKSGKSVTKDITLDQVGRFEVESHEPAFTILQLVVS